MDLSPVEAFKISNGLCAFSYNGLYVAVGNHQRLTVYPVAGPAGVLQIFTCSETIQSLEWSTDSELLLTSYPAKGKLEVWSVKNPEWKCKISLGQEGLESAFFAPSSRHVITISLLHVRLTIWSLTDRSVRHINGPKDANPGYDFSAGGTLMAVLERRGGKDAVGVYSCESWCCITVIFPEITEIGGIQWSPDSSKLVVWSELYPSKIVIYTVAGNKAAEFTGQGYYNIRSCLWAPTNQFLAMQSSKNSILLLNHLTWDLISTLSTYSKVYDPGCVIYEEKTGKQTEYEVVMTRPVPLTSNRDPQMSKRKPCQQMAFSADSRYLAVLDEFNPKIVCIWDVPKLSLKSILIQKEAVKVFRWEVGRPRLALCTGSPLVFFWTPLGCAVMNLRGKTSSSFKEKADYCFPVESLEWSNSGHALLIAGRDAACVHLFDSNT